MTSEGKLLEAAIAYALDDHRTHPMHPERLMAKEILRLREERNTFERRLNRLDDLLEAKAQKSGQRERPQAVDW